MGWMKTFILLLLIPKLYTLYYLASLVAGRVPSQYPLFCVGSLVSWV